MTQIVSGKPCLLTVIMKRTLLIISFLALGFVQAIKLPDEIIKIGKVSYKVKKETVISKDEWYTCKWLSLYSSAGQHQAGLIMEGRRNDTLFVSGTYKVDSNQFITKNYYHYRPRHEPDSSIKVFVQNSKGKLELKSFIKYFDGIANQIKW